MRSQRGLLLTTAVAPVLWGTTYIVTTSLLPDGRPLLAAVLRALPAGIALALVAGVRPHGIWWLRALVLGTLNIGALFALLFIASYRLPGGVAATLGSTQPLIAAALGAMVLGEALRRRTVFAGVLGIVGIALLVLRAGAQLDTIGVIAGLTAPFAMASGIVLMKRWGSPVSLLAMTGWQLVAGGVVLLPIALVMEGLPAAITLSNIVGFLWLGVVGTALAYTLWFRGVGRLPVAQVSLLGLLSPVVAITLGWVIAGQAMTPVQIMGLLLVLAALLIGQTGARAAHHADMRRSAGAVLLHRRRERPTDRCPAAPGATASRP